MGTTDYILKIVALLGGLALFLFGMDIMGKALQRQAGGKLQSLLAKMSSTWWKGLLLGTVVTAVIQSSSATTVMLVGFVNSGLMTLEQTLSVILGSNIGTTITAWLLSLSDVPGTGLLAFFKPSVLAPVLGVIGIVLYMFLKSDKLKGVGTILLGFMALMTGMELMSDAMGFLKGEEWFKSLMISFSNPFVGILFGAVLTAVIQSSSASVGILQSLCATGVVTYGAAIPIILGQNIGTCVTALLGSVGANRNARRTSLMHLIFKLVGVGVFSLVFYGLDMVIGWRFLEETTGAVDVAIVHTLYNVGATVLLLPFSKLLLKLAYVIIPRTKTPEKTVLLDELLLATPAVAVAQAQQVAGKMAQTAQRAMELASGLTAKYDPDVMKQVVELENETDHYEDQLGSYLVKLSDKTLSIEDNRILNTLLYTISDLERIGDHALNVAEAAQEMHEKSIVFSAQAQDELAVLQRAIGDIISRSVKAYTTLNMEQAMKVEPQEQVIDSLVREIKSRHIRRLRDGLCSVEYGFVLDDLLTAYERSADHCSNIAVEILQVADGKLEAHEYLNALKAGELRESAKYAERFARYQDRYIFPEDK